MDSKLSVRKQTCFKKPPSSVNIAAANKKTTNLGMREQTLLNKAFELSTLCDVQVCVIYYGPDGQLINTWPEDQSKVRDMAERFIKLSDRERRKKSFDLSQFLNKEMSKEKKKSIDNKFSLKVLEMERSLETCLRIFQDKLRLLSNHDQSLAVASSRTEQNNNFRVSSSGTELSSLLNDPLITHHHLMSGVSSKDLSRDVDKSCGFPTDPQNKTSIFMYNHDNATFTQLSDSASGFDQALSQYSNMSTALLGAQKGFGGDGIGLRSCSNNNIPTQNPFVQSWNQTPSS